MLHTDACTHCTRRLPAERNPPIEQVIGQNVIPRFVKFLQCNDNPQLQVRLGSLHPAILLPAAPLQPRLSHASVLIQRVQN